MRWGGSSDLDLSKLCIGCGDTLLEALRVIDRGAESIAFVVDAEGRVVGSLSDGDVRRALIAGATLDSRCISTVMRRDFAYVAPDTGRAEVLDIMRARDVGQLPVLDADRRLCGLHTIGELISVARRPNAAVILAGGRGTRLGPITNTVPKPMVKVAGRPILERLVLHLMGCGIRRFYLSVNYMADVIEAYFGDGTRFGCEISYLREETPLGTGGPLSLLAPPPEHPLVVLNGDLVTQCDVGFMLDAHAAGGYVATFGTKPYKIQIPYGVARVDGHRLVDIQEKPTHEMLINAGIYVLSPEVLPLVPREEEFPITELFARCLREGLPVGVHQVTDDWIDVGRPEELQRARGEA